MVQHAYAKNLLQTVPDNGSSVSAVAEGGKRIFGFIARSAVHRSDAGPY